MAVRSAELSRDAIWTRWRDRGVYGITGPRVLLDVTLGGSRMGQTVALPGDAPRTLTIRVAAPVPVLRVEIVRDDPEQPVEVVDLDPPTWNPDPLEWTDTTPLEAEAFYYVRVFLEGDDFAWSSPIWVEPT